MRRPQRVLSDFPVPMPGMQWWKKYIFLCPSGNGGRFGYRLVGRPVEGPSSSSQDDSRANNFYKLYAHMPTEKKERQTEIDEGKKLYRMCEREKSGDILGGKAITSPTDDWVRCRTPTRLTAPIITSNKGRPSSYLQPYHLLLHLFWSSRFLPVPQSAMFV